MEVLKLKKFPRGKKKAVIGIIFGEKFDSTIYLETDVLESSGCVSRARIEEAGMGILPQVAEGISFEYLQTSK